MIEQEVCQLREECVRFVVELELSLGHTNHANEEEDNRLRPSRRSLYFRTIFFVDLPLVFECRFFHVLNFVEDVATAGELQEENGDVSGKLHTAGEMPILHHEFVLRPPLTRAFGAQVLLNLRESLLEQFVVLQVFKGKNHY